MCRVYEFGSELRWAPNLNLQRETTSPHLSGRLADATEARLWGQIWARRGTHLEVGLRKDLEMGMWTWMGLRMGLGMGSGMDLAI